MDAKKNASPIELAALLMDAVCGQDEKERNSLEELATYLGIGVDSLQAELLFLRAFAVEFALVMALGDSQAKDELFAHYYAHWDRLAAEAGEQIQLDLQQRMQLYSEVVNEAEPGPEGLAGPVGQTFAGLFASEEVQPDLTHLGGSMFAALAAEIMDIMADLDIVLLGEQPED